VRRIAVGQSSEEPAPAASITKGYEYEQGRYVTVAPEELRAIVPQTSSDMEIVVFVRLAEIDPVYFEASYYVKPEEAGRKPYALLYEAMHEAGFAAVAQFAMHRRARVAIVRPGPSSLMAHTMHFSSEVRSDQEVRAASCGVVAAARERRRPVPDRWSSGPGEEQRRYPITVFEAQKTDPTLRPCFEDRLEIVRLGFNWLTRKNVGFVIGTSTDFVSAPSPGKHLGAKAVHHDACRRAGAAVRPQRATAVPRRRIRWRSGRRHGANGGPGC
jgi:hypothetical protein